VSISSEQVLELSKGTLGSSCRFRTWIRGDRQTIRRLIITFRKCRSSVVDSTPSSLAILGSKFFAFKTV
jgi:hypothetical protein